jgi:predicted Holliday junction resolvase-like endonuclease
MIIEIIFSLGLIGLISLYIYESKKYKKLLKNKEEDYSKLLSQKKSSEVRLGQISENLAPFLKDFKYNPKETHFIGMPIDYIIFEEDKIIFLEVKSGKSQLSTKQRNIRNLIKDNKVFWDEMRIE